MGLVMPAEPIDNGTGAVIYPYGINNTAAQTVGMNPNASWAVRAISQYNRPSITQVDYSDLDRATEWNQLILEEAQNRYQASKIPERSWGGRLDDLSLSESQRNAMSIQARKLSLSLREGVYNVFSNTNEAIGAAGEAIGAAGNWWVDQLRYTPSPGISTGANANVNLNPVETYNSAPNKSGYFKQSVVGYKGQVIGWTYVPFAGYSGPTPAISDSTPDAATQLGQNPTVLAQQGAARSQATGTSSSLPTISDADYYRGARNYMGARWSNDWTIYQKAAYLRDNVDQNRRTVAIEMYGQPVQTVDANGNTTENWASSGDVYYGLLAGESPPPRVINPPAKDAPYSDWVKYVNRMQQSQPVALYKVGSASPEVDSLTVQDYKDFQRALLSSGKYPPGTPVTLGRKTDFEYGEMERLMALANRNGLTWRDVLGQDIQAYNDALASGGIGGSSSGGGGGGDGSSTYTQTQYSQTSLSSARSLLSSVLTNSLGRMPTDEELKRFVQMLNDAESKSPTTTVTSTESSGGTTSSTMRTTPSTVDEQQMANEFAKQIGGGGEYNSYSADNYIAGLMQYLGG